MQSWYTITTVIGVLVVPFTILVLVYLIRRTRQLSKSVDEKWANVRISGPGTDRMTALTVPGAGQILELKIGGTVSSTSSVHPTKETWLNIQPSSSRAAPSNPTEKTTMGDLQEMFHQQKYTNKETQGNNKQKSKLRAKQRQSEA